MKKSIQILGAFLLSAVLVGGLYVFDMPENLQTSIVSPPQGGRYRGSMRRVPIASSETSEDQIQKEASFQPRFRGSNRRTPAIKASDLRHQKEASVEEKKKIEFPILENPTKQDNVLYQKNRNGEEVFYGYRAGELAPEKLLKIAYARRRKNFYEKGPQPSRNIRKINYTMMAERIKKKTAAPKSTSKRRITIRTPRPQDTLTSRRNVGVSPLKSHEVKYRKTRYSLRHSERMSGGAAETFKRAKAQLEERRLHESKAWAHDRKPDSSIRPSRIQLKNPRQCAYPPCDNKDAGGDILTLES